VLSDDEQAVLMARARSVCGAYRDRLRARIVLAAAAGMTNAAVAAHEGVHVDTVRKWRCRFAATWPNAHLIHLPRHASWLDQAEIYFSVVQRKALAPNDFTDLGQIRDRLAAFETRYNAIAKPFNWKFTRADLDDLLRRIDAHDNAEPGALAA
jgi:transposase